MARTLRLKAPDLRPYAREISTALLRRADARLFPNRALQRRVEGKRVLVTGASTGIGEVLAYQLARAGARVLLVARSAEKLETMAETINEAGGDAVALPTNLADLEDCDRLANRVLTHEGPVDILINNAGRSIRRSALLTTGRFHDYQRTMQLNYFGAIRLTLNLLPAMRDNGGGQVVNVSTVGLQTYPGRFSAYLASKGALDAWTMTVANEVGHHNIWISLVNLPLVRTPMIAPTEIYRYSPTISPEEASNRICKAIITRQKKITNIYALMAEGSYHLIPKIAEGIVNTLYQMTTESAASLNSIKKEKRDSPTDNIRPLRR